MNRPSIGRRVSRAVPAGTAATHAAVRHAAVRHAAVRQVASVLLGYPDAVLLDRLPVLKRVVAALPAPVAEPLARVLDHVERAPLEALQTAYVDTFDLRRRCCLYLTYYAYGDTRKRGMALLRFTHAYKAAGLELDEAELPDHLAVVLEFTATVDAVQGERLLCEHRPGLELLRLALEEAGSPYAHVLQAVCATLPALDVRDREAALRLAAEGPPGEEVGLDPYGPDPFAAPAVRPAAPVASPDFQPDLHPDFHPAFDGARR